MNSIHHGWSLDEIAPEARRAAERAAEAAGMPLEIWLNQLIKYVSAMELSGKGPARARAIDETIKRAAAEQARLGPVDGPALESDDTPMMLEANAPIEQPTTVAAEMLQPNRFAEEHPGERDVEQAIGEWRKSGALKPLVVRPDSRQAGHYEIVSGMERWHAASRLHMRRIPVTVQQLSDEEVLRATLIQKLNSKSLPPLDEAQIYQRLMEETGLSVATLSDVIGRSPTHVATALQLLDLPEPVREMINSGELSVLHARTLLGAADPEPAAREVVSRRLDIYQTEQLVRASHGALTPPAARAEPAAESKAEATPEAGAAASAPAAETAETDDAAVSLDAAAPAPAEVEAETTAESTAVTAPDVSDAAPVLETSSEPAASEPAAREPATSEPAPDEMDAAEAPLDMAEFITTDTAAPESAPDAVDTTSPIILGGPERDASTLIEASPAIDRPAADSPDMASSPDTISAASPTPERQAPEAPAPEAPAPETQIQESQADDSAGLAAPQAPAVAAPDALAVPAEENEPAGTEPAGAETDVSEPPAQPSAEPSSQPPSQPPSQPMEIPAAAAMSDERPAGAAIRGGNGDDREGHRDTYMSKGASSALGASGTSGGPTDADDGDEQVDRDDRDETRNDDSTRMVETHLSTLLGLKVSIAERNQDDGVLSIHYNSESELTDLVSRLNRMPTGRRAE